MIFLILILAAVPGAFALEAEYARQLLKAHSPNEITQLRADYNEIIIARAACRLQLQRKAVPVACFKAMNAEARWGLPGDSRKKRRRIEHLNRLCRQASADLHGSPLPSKDLEEVSSDCLQNLDRARARRDYRDADKAGPDLDMY